MSDNSAPPSGLPIPLLVNAATGQAYPPLPAASLPHLGGDLRGAANRAARAQEAGHLATDYSVNDPNDLSQTGWCVLFANDTQAAAEKEQLMPLLNLREKQVQDPSGRLFQIFEGDRGVKLNQTGENWAMYRGVSLTAPVSPAKGVPYYVLIVGGPERISFEFQHLLKMQWVVGRLAFDDIADYGRYAQAIVEYESKDFQPFQRKNAAIWVTRNGDAATAMLSGTICPEFTDKDNWLGSQSGFTLDAFTHDNPADKQATKEQLKNIMRGDIENGPPAVFFTGSHGADFSASDEATQRQRVGSLYTQTWLYGTAPPGENDLFSATDIPDDAQLQGSMAFLFACYGGGCPANDTYFLNDDGSPRPIAPSPMVARLPQALLSRGVLAIIAHVDMAWAFGFQNTSGTAQVQALRTPLELLMQGKRAGFAADSLSLMWSTLSANLGIQFGTFALSAAAAALGAGAAASVSQLNTRDATDLAYRTIARDDARNYIVLGDPAVKLRIEDLS
jgi:hypothetical protein